MRDDHYHSRSAPDPLKLESTLVTVAPLPSSCDSSCARPRLLPIRIAIATGPKPNILFLLVHDGHQWAHAPLTTHVRAGAGSLPIQFALCPQRSVVHHSPQSTARHGPVLCRPAQSARSLVPLRPLILQYPWLAHDSMPSSGGSPRLPSPHTGGLCRKVCELYKILKC